MNESDRNLAENLSRADPLDYPTNRVVASLDAQSVEEALAGLQSSGFDSDQVELLSPKDVADIDSPLDETGVKGFLERFVLSLGADLAILERMRTELAADRILVFVKVSDDSEKTRAVDILRQHDPSLHLFAGKWTFEGVE